MRRIVGRVCARSPEDFSAVGEWYADFSQTSDSEVPRLFPAVQFFTSESPSVAPVVKRLSMTVNRAERGEMYREGERLLLDELPAIPIGFRDPTRPLSLFLVRHGVRGFFDPVTGYADPRDFRRIWLDPKPG